MRAADRRLLAELDRIAAHLAENGDKLVLWRVAARLKALGRRDAEPMPVSIPSAAERRADRQ